MTRRKVVVTAIAAIVLGMASLPLAGTVFAAANTSGLVSLSLQGVGTGTLSGDVSTCGDFTCQDTDTCVCLTGAQSLKGNQGFGGGSFTFKILVDVTTQPVVDYPFCNPAIGDGTIANSKGKQAVTINISGVTCPTKGLTTSVFNGAYVVSGGSGKYSSSSGGAGSVSVSQAGASGASQGAVTGSLQATAP